MFAGETVGLGAPRCPASVAVGVGDVPTLISASRRRAQMLVDADLAPLFTAVASAVPPARYSLSGCTPKAL